MVQGFRAPDRRQSHSVVRQREGLIQAVAVGTLQASQDGAYWSPSYEAPSRRQIDVRAPLSVAWSRTSGAAQPEPRPSPELIVSQDQDIFQLCGTFPGKRCGLVCFATGPPSFRDLRESQLFFRTTYLYAAEEMPRQIHREVQDVLGQGSIIYTAPVTVLRGELQAGAPWLQEPVEIEVLTAGIQRTPQGDVHEQYARLTEKADVAKMLDDLFVCAAEKGIEVLIFPPFVGGSCGCFHPPADAGKVLRKAALTSPMQAVVVAPMLVGVLPGWASFSDAVLRGRPPIPRLPPIPLHLSPYFSCYLGKKKPDFTVFTLGKAGEANALAAAAKRSASAKQGPSP
ncbi:unnamed protein product [Symbiodinium microadriaticum]|nr:unnamed protein product [Symbiodinium microadriaticum]